MPVLAFGLRPANKGVAPSKTPLKRKAAFDDTDDGPEEVQADNNDAFSALQKPKPPSKVQPRFETTSSASEPPRKSTKLTDDNAVKGRPGHDSAKYGNLSALRSAKLQDVEASQLDASVYNYDEVYDTFAADKQKKNNEGETSTVPKYMTNLLASAEVRKRDQLRAKEKALQKERDAEGDEFADKEKFVTGAYKRQQEETKRLEEEEKKREEEEEERRKKGGGMMSFHKEVLRKDEERSKAVEQATREAQSEKADVVEAQETAENGKTDTKIAAELNEQGARIVVNDDGEIVDKRQLLSAGLNVAPKKPGPDKLGAKLSTTKAQEWQPPTKQQDARLAQRERQSRMMERQIEEIETKQKEAEAAEQKEQEDKNKSKLTESDKMGAKERYLQRKKEREEEARKAKSSAR